MPVIINQQRRRRRRPTQANPNPPSSSLSYRGPINGFPQESLMTTSLVFDSDATSSAGGVINTVFTDTPSASPDFSSLAAVYNEYRTLGMSVSFHPTVTGAVLGTLNYNVLYLVWAAGASDSTPLSSYTGAANYAVFRVGSLNEPMSLSHKMKGVEESTFVDTTSAVLDYNFKFYADSLTASTRYGHYTIKWVCQFRGRH